MSSILKALRKLEEEKAALGEGRVDLARDILKRSAPQSSPSSPLPLKLFLLAIMVIAISGLLWWQLRLVEPETASLLTAERPPTPAVKPRPALPASSNINNEGPGRRVIPVAESITPQSTPRASAAPVTAALQTPPKRQTEKTVSATAAVPAISLTVDPEAVSDVEPAPPVESDSAPSETPLVVETKASEQIQPPLPAPSFPADLPELRVDLILFRPEPEQRLAVINDLPVMEGTDVEGVRIVEIQRQQIKILWQGEELSLPWDK